MLHQCYIYNVRKALLSKAIDGGLVLLRIYL